MKTPTQDLFILIKSLTKNEKGYFKKYAQLNSFEKESNYILLFDYIAAQDSYDEAALKKHFKGEIFLKQLFVVKNYLFNLILKSIRNFESENKVFNRILNTIMDAEILVSKNLADKAIDKLNSALLLAQEYEYFSLTIEIESKLDGLKARSDQKNEMPQIENKDAFYSQQFNQLKNLIHFESIGSNYSRLVALHGRNVIQHASKELESLKTQNDSNQYDASSSLTAQTVFLNNKLVYEGLTNKAQFKIKNYQSLVEHFNKHPTLIEKRPEGYLNSIYNLGLAYNDAKNYTAMKNTAEELKAFLENTTLIYGGALNALGYSHVARLMLLYSIASDNYEYGIKQIGWIEKGLNSYTFLLKNDNLTGIKYWLLQLYFLSGNHKSALKLANNILEEKDTIRKDYMRYTLITILLLHFDKGATDFNYLLKTQFKSVRFLKSEKLLIQFINKNAEAENISILFKKLQLELNKLPDFSFMKNYINIDAWIARKTQNQTRKVLAVN